MNTILKFVGLYYDDVINKINTIQERAAIDSYTKLLLHFDGLNGNKTHAITCNGNAQLSTSQYKYRVSSCYFDGNGDYLTIPDSDDFYFDGDFTIGMWVYPTNDDTVNGNALLTQRDDVSGMSLLQVVYQNALVYVQVYKGGSGIFSAASSANSVPINTWTYIEFVKSGTNGTLYINGSADGSSTFTDTMPNIADTIYIGRARWDAPNRDYTGYIEELVISKGYARHKANFTAPRRKKIPDKYTVLFLSMEGTNGSTVIPDLVGGDSSVGYHIPTYNGDASLSTNQSKFNGVSLYLDGTGDYLEFADSTDFDILGSTSEDYTIDFWMRAEGLNNNCIYDQREAGNDNKNQIYITGTNKLGVNFEKQGSGVLIALSSTTTLQASTWYHIAIVKTNGTPYTVKLYINGIMEASTTSSTTNTIAASLLIGKWQYTTDTMFNGYIDEFRISKGIARWTTDFTPLSQAYDRNIKSLVGLLN